MNNPTNVACPLLKSAVVNPPICRHCGINVFTKHPIRSGITIIPPGNFFIVAQIFIVFLPSFPHSIPLIRNCFSFICRSCSAYNSVNFQSNTCANFIYVSCFLHFSQKTPCFQRYFFFFHFL